MYAVLRTVHSAWAYLVLLALLFAVVNAALGYFSNKQFEKKDFRIGLFGLIFTHIQLLIGGILYFVAPIFSSWQTLGGGVMKDAYLRKMLVEHPFGMVLGVALITIGWSLHKKQANSKSAFARIALFYALGLVAMLGVIPWATWKLFA